MRRIIPLLIACLILAGLTAGVTVSPAQPALAGAPSGAADRGAKWIVQVAPGEQPTDMAPGEYLHGAAIGPDNFQPGPSSGDWSVYRSVYVDPAVGPDCHPRNNHAFEVPNLVGINRAALGGRGYCYGMHLTTAPTQIGTPSGFGGRPKLTTNHYLIFMVPNPDYGRPGCKFCGTHLLWEGSARIMQIAFSPSQGSEVWYFKTAVGQWMIGGNIKLPLIRDAQGYHVDPNSNVKIASNIGYGDGQTPRRPGDEGVPTVAYDLAASGGAMGLVQFKRDIYPDIPRDNTGHTYELQTDDWLKCPLPPGWDAAKNAVLATEPRECAYTGREIRPTPIPIPTDDGQPTPPEPTTIPIPTSTPFPDVTEVPPSATPLPTEEPTATEAPSPADTATPAPEVSPTEQPTEARATATAEATATVAPVSSGFRALYYSDEGWKDFVLDRLDDAIDFDWQAGSPDPAIPADHFSAHWAGIVPDGVSGYFLRSDDGSAVLLDGATVLDRRDDPPYSSVFFQASPGQAIDVYYREGTGNAYIHLRPVVAAPATATVAPTATAADTPPPPTGTPVPPPTVAPTATQAGADVPPVATNQTTTTMELTGSQPYLLNNLHYEWIPRTDCTGGATRITDQTWSFVYDSPPPRMPADMGFCILARNHVHILPGRRLDQIIVRADDAIQIRVCGVTVIDTISNGANGPYGEVVIDRLPDGRPLRDVFAPNSYCEVNIRYINWPTAPGTTGNRALSWAYVRSF